MPKTLTKRRVLGFAVALVLIGLGVFNLLHG
jgi:hypothetical protein